MRSPTREHAAVAGQQSTATAALHAAGRWGATASSGREQTAVVKRG